MRWESGAGAYDLVIALGTLDTVNDLPLALRLLRAAMRPDALLIGAMSGGDTLPQLRAAMRAADAVAGVAAPHVHPRIEASTPAPLLNSAGFIQPCRRCRPGPGFVSLVAALVADLRAMAATKSSRETRCLSPNPPSTRPREPLRDR